MNKEIHFFWKGQLSQWAYSPFVRDGVHFSNCEQWMMYQKAELFDDLDTRDKIIKTTNPADHKKLGRRVTNFDDDIWMQYAYQIVVDGNMSKFSQHEPSRNVLQQTYNKILAEANPYDSRWGIGLAADDPLAKDQETWNGENMLGRALMDVRFSLFGNPSKYTMMAEQELIW